MVLLAQISYGASAYMVGRFGMEPVWAGLHAVGTYGVQLFFLISGFVIAMSVTRYDPGTFYRLRFARVEADREELLSADQASKPGSPILYQRWGAVTSHRKARGGASLRIQARLPHSF